MYSKAIKTKRLLKDRFLSLTPSDGYIAFMRDLKKIMFDQ